MFYRVQVDENLLTVVLIVGRYSHQARSVVAEASVPSEVVAGI